MGHNQCEFETTVSLLKQVYGKSKMYVTGDSKDYFYVINNKNPTLHKTWQEIANKCNESQLNGRAYLEWCFQKEYPSYPMPYKFNSEFKVSQYIALGKLDIQFTKEKLKLELMINRMNKLCKLGDPIEVLMDPLHSFDSLFKYIVAKNLNRQDELPEGTLNLARQQTFCQPVFAEKFDTIIPKEVFELWT